MSTKPKPYRATSLPAAQREVRHLRNRLTHVTALLECYATDLKNCQGDRRLLAKLAAKGPAFDDPLMAAQAEKIRDVILREECRMGPDGKYID